MSTDSPHVEHTPLDTHDADECEDDVQTDAQVTGVPRWTLWPGKNKFYCGGKILAGPETVPFSATCCLITIPVLMFLFFVCPGLVARDASYWWCVLIALAGLACMLGTLGTCHCCDPGIIPREAPSLTRRPRIINNKLEDGTIERWRYCETCHIYRPPRCHHCSDCDNCVEVFDHHCPWVGNCIARRNYRFFVLFLVSTGIMLAFVFGVSCRYFVLIKDNSDDLGETISNAPVALGLMIYCGVVFLPVLCLTSYHVNIISSGQTTKEEIKRMYQGGVNPNDHGCLHNWKLVLCGQRAPTKLPEMTALVHQATWCDVPDDDNESDNALLIGGGQSSGSRSQPTVDIEMGEIGPTQPHPPPYGIDDAHVEEVSVSPMKSPRSPLNLKSPSSSMSRSPLKSPISSGSCGKLAEDDISPMNIDDGSDQGDGISPLQMMNKSHAHLPME